jgi:hypothetical protein
MGLFRCPFILILGERGAYARQPVVFIDAPGTHVDVLPAPCCTSQHVMREGGDMSLSRFDGLAIFHIPVQEGIREGGRHGDVYYAITPNRHSLLSASGRSHGGSSSQCHTDGWKVQNLTGMFVSHRFGGQNREQGGDGVRFVKAETARHPQHHHHHHHQHHQQKRTHASTPAHTHTHTHTTHTHAAAFSQKRSPLPSYCGHSFGRGQGRCGLGTAGNQARGKSIVVKPPSHSFGAEAMSREWLGSPHE